MAVTAAARARDARPGSACAAATLLGIALFAPALVYIVALVGLPLVLAFLYSVSDVTVGSVGYDFVGLDNFRSVLESPTFRRALLNTFVFTVVSQVIVIVCANILALALRDFRGRGLVRFLMLLPWVAPIASARSAGSGCSTRSTASMNWVLARAPARRTVRPAHVARAAAPRDGLGHHGPRLADAPVRDGHPPGRAHLDPEGHPRGGARSTAPASGGTHFQITLPMMRPIMHGRHALRHRLHLHRHDVVYILTRGGPYDTTQVLPSLAFFTGILGGDLAEGAAISLFLVPILVAVAVLSCCGSRAAPRST